MLLYNLEIERRKNQRRAERYLQRLLGSHRSESAVFPPKCQNGCTFAWTANTQSHLKKCLKLNSASFTCCRCWGGWSQILRIGGFWKLPSRVPTFPTTFLLVFCSISPDVVCLLIWIPEKWFSRCGGESGDFYLKDRFIHDNWFKSNKMIFWFPPWCEQDGDVLLLVFLLAAKLPLLPQLGRPASDLIAHNVSKYV